MIPKQYLTEWRHKVPWKFDEQVEQDLVLSRMIVELFSISEFASSFAFRGGTSLNKIHLLTPVRYSEDIDLVQISTGQIGSTLKNIQNTLEPWLGKSSTKLKRNSATIIYKFPSTLSGRNLRIKIEINTREHYTLFGYKQFTFGVDSKWFSGSANVTTYHINELMGTKLRALFQRSKGRDLFDIWYAHQHCKLEPKKMIQSFLFYTDKQGLKITGRQFKQNLATKIDDKQFIADTNALLPVNINYDPIEAYKLITSIIDEHLN